MVSTDRTKEQIIFLKPEFRQMVWGGDRLGREWHYEIPGSNTGECWGVSAHPSGDCRVREGLYEGELLSELWKKHPELFGNTGLDRFPLLVKIIDAKADLSIRDRVHVLHLPDIIRRQPPILPPHRIPGHTALVIPPQKPVHVQLHKILPLLLGQQERLL